MTKGRTEGGKKRTVRTRSKGRKEYEKEGVTNHGAELRLQILLYFLMIAIRKFDFSHFRLKLNHIFFFQKKYYLDQKYGNKIGKGFPFSDVSQNDNPALN